MMAQLLEPSIALLKKPQTVQVISWPPTVTVKGLPTVASSD